LFAQAIMELILPDCLKQANVHKIGKDLAVLTLQDHDIMVLTDAVVDYIKNSNHLIYDQQSKDQRGRACTRSRGEGFFVCNKSDVVSYKIGNTNMLGISMPDCMRSLLNKVNTFVTTDFNAVFVNHYRDNNDGIPFHSDKGVNEDDLIGVFGVSWGASRILKFHPVDNQNKKLQKQNIRTVHGEALLMYGKGFQTKIKHGISKCKTSSGERFSFTFRSHNNTDSKKRKRD